MCIDGSVTIVDETDTISLNTLTKCDLMRCPPGHPCYCKAHGWNALRRRIRTRSGSACWIEPPMYHRSFWHFYKPWRYASLNLWGPSASVILFINTPKTRPRHRTNICDLGALRRWWLSNLLPKAWVRQAWVRAHYSRTSLGCVLPAQASIRSRKFEALIGK